MKAIPCIGPGPHAPADGILGEVSDDEQVPRAVCAACAEHPLSLPAPPALDAPAALTLDVLVLAADLADQRARLDVAQAALTDQMTPDQLQTAVAAGWLTGTQEDA